MSGRGQTPARVTRSRANTPLPALQTRQSHAYGAAGKASLQSQVITSQAELDQAFTTAARASREPTARRRTRAKGAQSVIEQAREPEPDPEVEVDPDEAASAGEESPEPPAEERPGTSLQESALYAQNYQSPPRPPPPRTVTAQRPALPSSTQAQWRRPNRSPQNSTSRGSRSYVIEPPAWKIWISTQWRFMPHAAVAALVYIFIILGIFLFSFAIFWFVPLSGSMNETRGRIVVGTKIALGLPGYDPSPSRVEDMYERAHHWRLMTQALPILTNQTADPMQSVINYNFIVGLQNATRKISAHGDAIEEIQRLLPSGLALVQEDGEWVIPSLFWKALLDKVGGGEDAALLWQKFLAANDQQILDMQDTLFRNKFDAEVSKRRLLFHSDLQAALLENRRQIEASVDERLATMKTEIIEVTKEMFTRDVANTARWNIAYAMDRRLHERNYISPAMGALVDPRITSATFGQLSTLQTAGLYVLWMTGLSGLGLIEAPKNSPVVSLLSWEEPTQCWCSVHDSRRKPQLGIQMAHKIRPDELLIEHVPADGTLDIASAPRKFEMWAQAANEAEAEHYRESLRRRTSHTCGEPPSLAPALWICLTTGEYDIHSPMYIQSFNLDFSTTADANHFLTDRIVFKVLDNWGAKDHTCIYRLRLTGNPDPKWNDLHIDEEDLTMN